VLAVATVVLGVAAHGEAGGSLAALVSPSPALVLVAVLVAAAVLGAGRDRPVRPLRVLGVLGAGQAALHLVLDHPAPTAVGDAAHAGHPGMGGMPSVPGMGGMPGMDAAGPALLGGGMPAMLAAHLLVTLAVGAGVVGADRVLVTALTAGRGPAGTALDAWLRRVLRVLLPPPGPTSVVRPAPLDDAPALRAQVLLTRLHPRRGPPAVAA